VNKFLKGEVGPKTIHIPSGEKLAVFDAAMVNIFLIRTMYSSVIHAMCNQCSFFMLIDSVLFNGTEIQE
jgi:hypothetical protein